MMNIKLLIEILNARLPCGKEFIPVVLRQILSLKMRRHLIGLSIYEVPFQYHQQSMSYCPETKVRGLD